MSKEKRREKMGCGVDVKGLKRPIKAGGMISVVFPTS